VSSKAPGSWNGGPDPDDARATRLHLTSRGRRLGRLAARDVTRLEPRIEDRIGDRGEAPPRAILAGVTAL
jgi:DNA-binding MarR family transcriptional regulator